MIAWLSGFAAGGFFHVGELYTGSVPPLWSIPAPVCAAHRGQGFAL